MTSNSSAAFAAFEEARQCGDPFDTAFVDLTMPGDIGGAAVVTRLQGQDAALKVVVMSGYSVSPLPTGPELKIAERIQKPFTLKVLHEVLLRL